MYRAFGDAELGRRGAHRGVVLQHIDRELISPVVQIPFHPSTLPSAQCMLTQEAVYEKTALSGCIHVPEKIYLRRSDHEERRFDMQNHVNEQDWKLFRRKLPSW